MRQQIHHWLNKVRVTDPIQQQQVATVQVLMLTTVVAAALAAVFYQFSTLPLLARTTTIIACVQLSLGALVAFLLVHRTHFIAGVILIITTALCSVGLALLAVGLSKGGALLFVLAVPIAFAGLLGSRRLLIVTAVMAALTVLAIYAVEPLTQPIFASARSTDPLGTIGIFLITLLVLMLVTSNFAAALRNALLEAHKRQRELEAFGALLEARVAKRTDELQVALDVLRESERRQRAMIDALPDTICRLSGEGVCIDLHAQPAAISGIAVEQFIGRSVQQTLPKDFANRLMQAITLALTTSELQRFEQYHIGTIQQHDYEVRVLACGENEVLAIIRDITERQQVERLKSEFLSVVSHELRTPLTSIRGSIGLVAGGVAGAIPPQAQAMLAIAVTNSERLVRLINDLLDSEKIETGEMHFDIRPTALTPIIEQAVAGNQGYSSQFQVSIETNLRAGAVRVAADSDRLLQVLANLISNAVKFSPTGGVVRIASACCDNQVRVEVEDQGPGIEPAFRERLFQKFAQANASDSRIKGGTGLGLSISRAIIEGCGGQIGFEPTDHGGSRFFFELPMLVEQPELSH